MSEAMSQEELEQRINKMSDEEQAHFKLLIYKLVMCYGEGQAQGVVIIGRAEARAASGDINMLEADIIKHQDDLNAISEQVDNTYQTYYKAKSEADLLDAEYGQLRQQRDTLLAGLKTATETKGQLVGQARKAEDLMAHRIELNTAGRAAAVQSILDAKGFDEVVRAGETLLEQEQLAPGLIHTLEEAALKKGDRASTQGIRNGVDAVVRVAAKQKPRLIKWTGLIKAGDSL